jgi:hypothetical protein
VVGTNVTIRMSEGELRKLDELTQRMNKTRSDVIRDLISRFDEVLKQEVEKERKRWIMIGFMSALEEAILDPELVLRFIRKNVDILGYPDFLIGMTRVRNRVVVFSHHDKVGDQLLRLVRAKIEEEVKREEMEIEQEDVEGEGADGGGSPHVRVRVGRPIKPSAPHAAPGSHRYKILVSSRSAPPVGRTTAVAAAGRSVVSGRSGNAEITANTTVPEKQKVAESNLSTTADLVGSEAKASNPQASVKGGATGPSGPVEQTPVGGRGGDFILALITNLYHKHREALLKAVEDMMGD